MAGGSSGDRHDRGDSLSGGRAWRACGRRLLGAVGCLLAAVVGAAGGTTSSAATSSAVTQEATAIRPQTVDLELLAGVVLGEIEGRLGYQLSVPWTLKWAEPGRLPSAGARRPGAASTPRESCSTA